MTNLSKDMVIDTLDMFSRRLTNGEIEVNNINLDLDDDENSLCFYFTDKEERVD